MSILEILGNHYPLLDQTAVFEGCACGWGDEDDDHDEHLAEILEKHLKEQQRRAWDSGAHQRTMGTVLRESLKQTLARNPYRREVKVE